MSGSFALVELNVTRTIQQAEPADPLSLEGLRVVELSLFASEAALGHDLDAIVLLAQCEVAMRAVGLIVRTVLVDAPPGTIVTPRSARASVRIEEMQTGTPSALDRLRLAAEGLKSMRSVRPLREMEAHESVIAWQGLEIGAEKGETFFDGAAAALVILLQEFSADFRKAN